MNALTTTTMKPLLGAHPKTKIAIKVTATIDHSALCMSRLYRSSGRLAMNDGYLIGPRQ